MRPTAVPPNRHQARRAAPDPTVLRPRLPNRAGCCFSLYAPSCGLHALVRACCVLHSWARWRQTRRFRRTPMSLSRSMARWIWLSLRAPADASRGRSNHQPWRRYFPRGCDGKLPRTHLRLSRVPSTCGTSRPTLRASPAPQRRLSYHHAVERPDCRTTRRALADGCPAPHDAA